MLPAEGINAALKIHQTPARPLAAWSCSPHLFPIARKGCDGRLWPIAEMLAAARHGCLLRVNLPAASPFVNPDSAHHGPRREPLDASGVPRPSTCPAAARSAASRSMPARWRAAPASSPTAADGAARLATSMAAVIKPDRWHIIHGERIARSSSSSTQADHSFGT
jgi:hypothetical protein